MHFDCPTLIPLTPYWTYTPGVHRAFIIFNAGFLRHLLPHKRGSWRFCQVERQKSKLMVIYKLEAVWGYSAPAFYIGISARRPPPVDSASAIAIQTNFAKKKSSEGRRSRARNSLALQTLNQTPIVRRDKGRRISRFMSLCFVPMWNPIYPLRERSASRH